jgi:type IV secretion system protein VirB10
MSDLTDAADDVESTPPSPQRPAFDRGISPISGRWSTGLGGKAVVLAALVAGCGMFVAATWRSAPAKPDQPPQAARQVVPFEPLARPAAPTLAQPGPDAPNLGGAAKAAPPQPPGQAQGGVDPLAQRRAALTAIRSAPLLAYSRGSATSPNLEALTPASLLKDETSAAPQTELEQLRQGSAIGQVRATRLPDRNFLIVAGASIPCILQTAMDTATPGYVSCVIPRDVWSDNGAVVLLEKGAKVLGEHRSSLRQGQHRLFVLWTRAVTPAGVAIELASPAADPLGRAGFDGDLDTHFWARFGGALLLSIVDDGAYAVAGRDTGAGTTRLPSDAAGVALQNSINIPPSLKKPQGSEVSIFVAQDFDFSSVYGLKAR